MNPAFNSKNLVQNATELVSGRRIIIYNMGNDTVFVNGAPLPAPHLDGSGTRQPMLLTLEYPEPREREIEIVFTETDSAKKLVVITHT